MISGRQAGRGRAAAQTIVRRLLKAPPHAYYLLEDGTVRCEVLPLHEHRRRELGKGRARLLPRKARRELVGVRWWRETTTRAPERLIPGRKTGNGGP